MSVLAWQKRRNLEFSLYEFLKDCITTEDLQVVNCGELITPYVTVGWAKTDDWHMPVISVYVDSINCPRSCIGSNCRQESYLMIIDIRAYDIGMQSDLTDWVKNKINDGWNHYTYQPNPSDPLNPTKTLTGYTSINFQANTAVVLGDNTDVFEQFRQNITIETWITPTS